MTMTERFGVKLNAYPKNTGDFIRYRPYFPLDETLGHLHRNKECYLLHPVRETWRTKRAYLYEALSNSKYNIIQKHKNTFSIRISAICRSLSAGKKAPEKQ
ncbi:hypothetical protein [Paenibacillus sp. GP183]|uniref:hypothetical protein n=1 Tax=Paenibacillus sp. GP183 TaxID=1882751 RepID=UPI0014957CA5|nr:hypothetical protein [Paenibacillus sp. GP183]